MLLTQLPFCGCDACDDGSEMLPNGIKATRTAVDVTQYGDVRVACTNTAQVGGSAPSCMPSSIPSQACPACVTPEYAAAHEATWQAWLVKAELKDSRTLAEVVAEVVSIGMVREFGAIITFVSNIPGETQTLPLALFTAIQSAGGEDMAARLVVISVVLALVTLFAAALWVLPVALVRGEFHVLWPPFSTAELALLAHMILAGFNFYAIFELIRISGPTYMSQANSLSVCFGVVFGIVFFDESHSLFVWAAMPLVLGGVALVGMRGPGARK